MTSARMPFLKLPVRRSASGSIGAVLAFIGVALNVAGAIIWRLNESLDVACTGTQAGGVQKFGQDWLGLDSSLLLTLLALAGAGMAVVALRKAQPELKMGATVMSLIAIVPGALVLGFALYIHHRHGVLASTCYTPGNNSPFW